MTDPKIPPDIPPGDEAAPLLQERLDPVMPAPDSKARILQRVVRRTTRPLNGARHVSPKNGKTG